MKSCEDLKLYLTAENTHLSSYVIYGFSYFIHTPHELTNQWRVHRLSRDLCDQGGNILSGLQTQLLVGSVAGLLQTVLSDYKTIQVTGDL